MTTYVGRSGRVHRRAPDGKAICLTILAMTMIGLLIIGQQNMANLMRYIGL